MKHTYYIEISKEAEVAQTEDGQPSEAYLQASFNSDETFYTEEQILKYISELSQIPKEYHKLITEEEYKKQTEGDES